MDITEAAIDDLTPHPDNPRQHDPRQIEALAAAIARYQFLSVIVIDENNTILAGHARVEAARRLNYKTLPALRITGAGEEERRAFMLADNKLGDLSAWNARHLAEIIDSLIKSSIDLTPLAFSETELAELLAARDSDPEPAGVTDPRDDIDFDLGAVTREGDLWRLGDHLLYIGDSSSAAPYEAFAAAGVKRYDLLLTDPPYGVEYASGDLLRTKVTARWGRIQNDDLKGDSLTEMIRQVLARIDERLDGAFYIYYPQTRAVEFTRALAELEWRIDQEIIWVKDRFASFRTRYPFAHESILYGAPRRVKQTHWAGGATQSSVWHTPRPATHGRTHPTQKPLRITERAIAHSLPPRGVVIDPFLGAGTTIIAAERAGARALGVEIAPHYADRTIAEWERLTNRKATHAGTGAEFTPPPARNPGS